MLVAEKDANSKRCLMLELIQAVHGSAAPGGPKSPVGCIGSNCMWWRWGYAPEEAKGNKNGPLGYCGLAGKPA